MVRSGPRERRQMAYSAISSGASPVMSGPFARRTSALATPNTMQPDYGCTSKSRGQGAGALIQDYFARYSTPAAAALFPRFD